MADLQLKRLHQSQLQPLLVPGLLSGPPFWPAWRFQPGWVQIPSFIHPVGALAGPFFQGTSSSLCFLEPHISSQAVVRAAAAAAAFLAPPPVPAVQLLVCFPPCPHISPIPFVPGRVVLPGRAVPSLPIFPIGHGLAFFQAFLASFAGVSRMTPNLQSLLGFQG